MGFIFGIHGGKRCGKDTTANILINNAEINKISLADPIKQIVSAATGISILNFYDDYEKDRIFDEPFVFSSDQIIELINQVEIRYPLTKNQADSIELFFNNQPFISIRDILQKFGTDCCRNLIDQDIWLKIFEKEINDGRSYVIPDVRFPNEFDLIKRLNGYMILVKRNTGLVDDHISENMDIPESKFDIIIDNNSTISKLNEEVSLWYTLKFNNSTARILG